MLIKETMMNEEDYKKIREQNIRAMNKRIFLYTEQFKDAYEKDYPCQWLELLQDDGFYQFLNHKLAEIYRVDIYPSTTATAKLLNKLNQAIN